MAPSISFEPSDSFTPLSSPSIRTKSDFYEAPSTQIWSLEEHIHRSWDGSTYATEESYTYFLTEREILDIEAALQYFKTLGLDGNEINRSNFPLPTLQTQLQNLAVELHDRRGFFVLRGLDPAHYSAEENILIFLGISSYIGEARGKQDDEGNMLAHIRQAEKMTASQDARPIRDSNIASDFHNDMFCDILAMQTRSCAASGGHHLIASTAKIYSELAASRPELISILASPTWTFDTRGRLAQAEKRPLLYYHDGHLILNFVSAPLIGVPGIDRSNGLPELSSIQLEALQVVQSIAVKHQLVLQMRPGDLTFVNNLSIVHAREGFKDSKVNTRYLVRMWLRNERLKWKLPRPLSIGNRILFDEDDIQEKWNILYIPRISFNVRERFTP